MGNLKYLLTYVAEASAFFFSHTTGDAPDGPDLKKE